MTSKYDHVRQAPQTRAHHCHWPGCERQVPPAMWGCKTHWFRLPARLRARVWDAYEPGQEERGDPSEKYLAVAQEVQDWIREQLGAGGGECPACGSSTRVERRCMVKHGRGGVHRPRAVGACRSCTDAWHDLVQS